MGQVKYFLLFFLFTGFALSFFKQEHRRLGIYKTGKEKVAIINSIPKCGRTSNTVKVLLFGKNYEIEIAKNKCFEGFYQLGDPVKVIYSDIYDGAINANANVKIGYWMSICFFIIPIYLLYKLVRGDKSYSLKPTRKKIKK